MKRRDIVIGIVLLAAIVGLFYLRNRRQAEEMRVPEQEVSSESTEQRIEEIFNTDIPDDVEKAELKAVDDGDGSAIATRKEEEGSREFAVLADLPDPETGKFYEAWLVKDDEQVSLGGMRVAKGGWVLETTSTRDLGGFDKVVVSLESSRDNEIEDSVLEGEF
jgi:hypothetical protein